MAGTLESVLTYQILDLTNFDILKIIRFYLFFWYNL